MKSQMKLNIRIFWYSVTLYLTAFLIGGLVLLPWFYFVLPLVVLLFTIYYFDKDDDICEIIARKLKSKKDRIFALGLWVATFWFLVSFAIVFFEIASFYYFDFAFFFSDPRNYLIFPLVLIVPVVYSLILEKAVFKKKRRRKYNTRFAVFRTLAKI